MPIWKPTGPYIIQGGKRSGKCLELMMFSDYPFLSWHFAKLNHELNSSSTLNRYHKHLHWLLERGENRQATKVCPRCNEKTACVYSVRYSATGEASIVPSFICCNNLVCQAYYHEIAFKTVTFKPLKFSTVSDFPVRYEQRDVYRLLRSAFNLQGRLTKERAFDFFAEDY